MAHLVSSLTGGGGALVTPTRNLVLEVGEDIVIKQAQVWRSILGLHSSPKFVFGTLQHKIDYLIYYEMLCTEMSCPIFRGATEQQELTI